MTWTSIIIFTIIVCVIAGVGEYRAQRKANELPFTDTSPVTLAEEADRREAGGL